MDIGKTIVSLRTAGGMSQNELADLLFVSRTLISKWESGIRRPDLPMIERIAAAFDVPVERIADKNDLIFKELSECVPPEAQIPEEQLPELLNAFLRGLSSKNADVFLKRYYFLQPASEIAADYGIAENHVRSILSKTRKKLKNYLKEAQNGRKEFI